MSVEKAIPSLAEATDFLVTQLCADKLAEEVKRVELAEREAARERQKKACDEQKASGKSRPGFLESLFGYGYDPCVYAEITMAEVVVGLPRRQPDLPSRPPSAMSYAARLLLDLRLARLKTDASKEAR